MIKINVQAYDDEGVNNIETISLLISQVAALSRILTESDIDNGDTLIVKDDVITLFDEDGNKIHEVKVR